MQAILSKIKYMVGNIEILKNIQYAPVLRIFSDEAISFLSALSKELFNDVRTKSYPDVMSYAYWIRHSSIEKAKVKYSDSLLRIGRGVSFHITPSNVPVNFAVSMTSALLAGNAIVIRVSNKEFEQVDIICDAINKLLDEKFESMKSYFCFIRYDYDEEITQWLSSICDLRIVWGGNNTIETMRKFPLLHRAIEMTFADRYSLSIIDSDEYLKGNTYKIAEGFYTDTYYTDQNACSSPRIVVWTGNSIEKARDLFWNNLYLLVDKDYNLKPIQSIDKYLAFCKLALKYDNISKISDNNLIVRVQLESLQSDFMQYKESSGYFFEYIVKNNLEEIVPILTKQCQTVSVYGINKKIMTDIVLRHGVKGVDRVVDLGQTMSLDFIWDGYDMIKNMSRIIYIGE